MIRKSAVKTFWAGLGMALALSVAQAQTVKVLFPTYSDKTLPYMQKMAAEFEQKNPGSKIQLEATSWDDLESRLKDDIAKRQTPDVAIIATRWLLDYVENDAAEPLDAYMSAEFKRRFFNTFMTPGTVQGKTYGLPIAASARALFYNKDLLSKVGYPNGPKTWDDILNASRKLKKLGVAGFGVQGKEVETDVYFYYAMWAHGGEIYDQASKRFVFDSPAGIKAATLYRQMISEGLTQPKVLDTNREDLREQFVNGKLGMVIMHPPLSAQIQESKNKVNYGIVRIPANPVRSTYAVTDSIMLFKSSQQKATAWKFVDYLFTTAPRVQFSAGEGFLPVTRTEASSPAFTTNVDLINFVASMSDAKFAPTIRGWENTAKTLTGALQTIYSGKAKPADALQQAAREANQHLQDRTK